MRRLKKNVNGGMTPICLPTCNAWSILKTPSQPSMWIQMLDECLPLETPTDSALHNSLGQLLGKAGKLQCAATLTWKNIGQEWFCRALFEHSYC